MSLGVTIVCCTYGRHKNLTEEMFESFLRQDYENKKLVVINTHPDPIEFETDYPNIQIVNEPDRFSNLREKMMFSFSFIDTELWGNFDDDDIFLPWHISSLVKAWEVAKEPGKRMAVYHQNMIYSEENKIKSVTQWDMWPCYLYEKPDRAFLEFAASVPIPSSDNAIKNWNGWTKVQIKYPSLPSFVYRWGTGSRHLSGFGSTIEARQKGWDLCRKEANAIKNENPWSPHWDRDYVHDVVSFIQKNQPLYYNGVKQELPIYI